MCIFTLPYLMCYNFSKWKKGCTLALIFTKLKFNLGGLKYEISTNLPSTKEKRLKKSKK